MFNNEYETRDSILQELVSLLTVASAVDTDNREAMENLPCVCNVALKRAIEVQAWFINNEVK